MDGRRFGSIVHMSGAGGGAEGQRKKHCVCGRPRAKRSVQLVAQVNWRNSERRSSSVGKSHEWVSKDVAMATGSRWV